MEYKDYYQTLGVARDATQDSIKRAYRKLARKYHPDVSKEVDADAKFKELGEAYEVLKDPEKRAAYDQLGANWQAGQDFRPPPGWDAGFEFSGGEAGFDARRFSEFFEQIFGRGAAGQQRTAHEAAGGFGGGYRQAYQSRGEDRHARILIDLDDAFAGATRAITLHAPEVDQQGHVRTRERTLNVRIPKGVRSGQHIRLAGQGSPGVGGGAAGDLYLEVEFKPHRWYHVEERDLYLDLPLAPWEAALGAKVRVPTPAGAVGLNIHPGTAAGARLRLKGRGIPGEPPGDLYAVVQIVLPPAATDAARALYEKMAREMPFNPRAAMEE
ncbi:MAG: DnaJ domain-containing protein [Gammaproteobacteria bacterium]|nr:DnaJ domain-containing protein [Gammaproteobacteria bacterium]